jgi:hypothetical protein
VKITGSNVINWPCVLKLVGDNELLYLADTKALHLHCEDCILHQNDRLIDSKGNCYSISVNFRNEVLLKGMMTVVTLAEITELIKVSEFSKGTLCLTKIHFQNLAQAIQSLAIDLD